MNSKATEVFIAVLAVFGTLLLIFMIPVISFGFGYLTGWILQITIGGTVASGLNMVFNTDRFTPEMIPLFCATMGLIGGFFKSKELQIRKKKDDQGGIQTI